MNAPLPNPTTAIGATLSLPRLRMAAPVLALGAYFKNTPCLLGEGGAVFGLDVGDLDRPQACAELERVAEALLDHIDCTPMAVAHDLHPDFHSSRLAQLIAQRLGVPALAVQHHHAHVETVLSENGWLTEFDGPALGLALDGVGLGSDGEAWGGELLLTHGARFERLGHLVPLPLAGGDRAAREPWRMAAAVLHRLGRGDEIARRFAAQPSAGRLAQVLERAHLCPLTSSMGRWFDAVAGLLGVCEVMRFEAEAAIALERAAREYGPVTPEAGDWRIDERGRVDLLPLCAHLADDRDPGRGAARFHAALVEALDVWVARAAETRGVETVALSGGCFLNAIVSSGLRQRLRARGLRVFEALQLSPGDAGLGLGQARVAAMMLAAGAETSMTES